MIVFNLFLFFQLEIVVVEELVLTLRTNTTPTYMFTHTPPITVTMVTRRSTQPWSVRVPKARGVSHIRRGTVRSRAGLGSQRGNGQVMDHIPNHIGIITIDSCLHLQVS